MHLGTYRTALNLMVAGALTFATFGCSQDDKEHDTKRHDGRATEQKMPTTNPAAGGQQLPAAVRAGFDREFPGATIREVEKETYPDGTIHWEVEFTTKDGKKMEKEFDQAGKLLADH